MHKKTKYSIIDRKILGDEPKVSKTSTALQMINAYNWLNYFYTAEDSKQFVLEYMKMQKMNKKLIKNIGHADAFKLINVGWNCKLLLSGNEIPIDIETKMLHKIHTLASQVKPEVIVTPIAPVSVQEHIENKANKIIATLEDQIDMIAKDGTTDFDIQSYFRTVALKPQVAKNVIEYYKPLYSEIYDTINGDSSELKYAYRNWSKKALKTYLTFVSDIISAAEVYCVRVTTIRKPRKKKVKPVSVIVSKVKYKQEDTTFKIKSIKPTDIVGANQVWLFNTKYRTLSVINAMSHSGLSVKGTTIGSFDEKTSITKKLRKPDTILSAVNDAGKVQLRKVMDSIKCKPKIATGRINSDTIILRTIK
jgi:hypothetical protein